MAKPSSASVTTTEEPNFDTDFTMAQQLVDMTAEEHGGESMCRQGIAGVCALRRSRGEASMLQSLLRRRISSCRISSCRSSRHCGSSTRPVRACASSVWPYPSSQMGPSLAAGLGGPTTTARRAEAGTERTSVHALCDGVRVRVLVT